MKTLIKNANIIDGTGNPAIYGGIVIEDDILTEVGPLLEEHETEFDEIIDADGMVVCPGFIDTHSHSDVMALTEKIILPKIFQGITTEVLGQDGVAMAPIPAKYSEDWRKNIGGLDGDSDRVLWQYDSIKDYLKKIEENKPCSNFACLAPHGNIRLSVMGFSDQPATEEQIRQMEQILRQQLEEGAIGLSTGLIYIPCVFSKTEELVRLCKIVAEYGKVFVVHQRFQNEFILDSMEELKHIVKESGVHLHISHIQVDGKAITDMRFDLYKKIDEIKALGAEVTLDQYPYTVASTMMGAIMPAWAHAGGTGKLLKRLEDPIERKKIKEYLLHPEGRKEENTIKISGYDGIRVSSVNLPENQKFVGKNMTEIGQMTGKDPIDAVMDLLLSEENKVGMTVSYTTEECIIDHMKRPEMNLFTDGLLGGKPHPRVYGAFPRFIGRYTREKRIFSLEEAIYKCTGKAADAMGFFNRGKLLPGRKADIVIFNPNTVIDTGTFEEPRQYPKGIIRVIVNGKTVVNEDKYEENMASGEIIKL